MILLLIILTLSLEPQLPAGATCDMIRTQVAVHGYLKAVVWARSQGYSWAQIREAKKCLK
jgi:hypothetical protein